MGASTGGQTVSESGSDRVGRAFADDLWDFEPATPAQPRAEPRANAPDLTATKTRATG